MMGAATEKARLPMFSLVLGIKSCCEVDDLSCLGIEKLFGDRKVQETSQIRWLVVYRQAIDTIFRMPIYPMLNRWNANPMTPNPGLCLVESIEDSYEY